MHKPAESGQTLLNVHYTYRDSRGHTGMLEAIHAGIGIQSESRHASIRTIYTVQSKMLFISAVMPIMSIYRLPLGQYEYAGHVINLPQDIVSFAQYLSAELDASLAPWRLRHPSYILIHNRHSCSLFRWVWLTLLWGRWVTSLLSRLVTFNSTSLTIWNGMQPWGPAQSVSSSWSTL